MGIFASCEENSEGVLPPFTDTLWQCFEPARRGRNCGRGRLTEMGRSWGIAKICSGCPWRKGTCCTGAVGDRCGMIPLRSTAAIDLGMQGRNGLLAVFEHGQGSGKPGGRVRKTFRQCRGNENGCHRGSFAVCGGAMMRGLVWSSRVESSKSWSGEIDGIMVWLCGSLTEGVHRP